MVRNGTACTVTEIDAERNGVRFLTNTPAKEVIQAQNFFNTAYVINAMEVPYEQFHSTRSNEWFKINQDFCTKMPERATPGPGGTVEGLLSEDEQLRVCTLMYRFAKQTGYGLRTHNLDTALQGRQPASVSQRP